MVAVEESLVLNEIATQDTGMKNGALQFIHQGGVAQRWSGSDHRGTSRRGARSGLDKDSVWGGSGAERASRIASMLARGAAEAIACSRPCCCSLCNQVATPGSNSMPTWRTK
jgi:hypothetical protein